MKNIIIKIILPLLIILASSTQIFANTKPNVLVLHSYHPAYKWTNDVSTLYHTNHIKF